MYLLDIDVDFLVTYVPQLKRTGEHELEQLDKSSHVWLSPENLVMTLKEKGFDFRKTKAFSFDNHKESFQTWQQYCQPADIPACLIHIDNHHDLYDCQHYNLRKMTERKLGCANYLWYALMYDYLSEIIWVVPSLDQVVHNSGQLNFIHNFHDLQDKNHEAQGRLIFKNYHGEPREIPLIICELQQLPVKNRPVPIATIAQSRGYTPPKTFSYAHYLARLINDSS
ncbi:MAG: hypothetical protein SCK28_15385 [Bacillota bacterium]|nr:hypothetical protein [Bacillota bacterium]